MAQILLSTENDSWSYSWSKKGFSSSRLYQTIQPKEVCPKVIRNIWSCSVILKYKIFLWLMIFDRVHTRNLLHRKSFHMASYNCVLCTLSTEETSLHLFWDCPFSLQWWDHIAPQRLRGISCLDHIQLIHRWLPKEIAAEIIIMGCWHISMQRNNWISRGTFPSITAWKKALRSDLLLLDHRIKHKFKNKLSDWIDHNLNSDLQ